MFPYIISWLSVFFLYVCVCVSSEGMKMRGMKNETNGSAKQASKVVSDGQTIDVLLFCIEFLELGP